MTMPLTPDAWAEARELVRQSLKGGVPGLTEATREAVVGSIMLKLTNKVLAPLLAAHQQVTAERDEARNPFGNLTPTVERVALLMGQVWLEAKGGTGDTITSTDEFALFSPEDYADCCTVAKAVLAAVDPVKANERADAAEASLATAASELARLRERLEIAHAYDGAGTKIPFPEGMEHLDGIECRDETIRNLEEQVARLRAEGEDLRAYARKVGTTLVRLTCDGSEFYTRAGDDFRVDADACDTWVRRSRQSRHEMIVRLTKEVSALRAEGEAKDRALKEIAEHPENYDDGRRSYAVGWAFWNIQNIARTALARAATAREGA